MKTIILILVLAACICKTEESKAQVNKGDSMALVHLYDSTGGANWSNNAGWLDGPVNTWHGITLDATGTRVAVISLPSSNLTGMLPSTLGNLTALTNLSLNNNLLSDTIPSSIGSLKALGLLNLGANQLNGNIPSSIGNLSALTTLNLSVNQLNDSIPSTIYNLTGLQILYLNNNKLTGNISSSIGNLINLQYLFLNNNQLSGSIPISIGNLTSLTFLDLAINQLSGNIPISIGNLTSLTDLIISYNKFTGTIPSSIGNLTSLLSMYINNNQLSGSTLSFIGNITNLRTLDLSENQLSGDISFIEPISPLGYLNLCFNQFSGSIPPAIGNLTRLTYVYLNNNNLSGDIPSSMGNMVDLDSLNLSNNQLSGSIPSAIADVPNLQALNLSNNKLSGTIPSSIGSIVPLASLNLSNNQLSGTIPKLSLESEGPPNVSLIIGNNDFTFNGMEAVAQIQLDAFLSYAPQANIPLNYKSGHFYVAAGGTLANDTFRWYKDNILFKKVVGDSVLTTQVKGIYSVSVTNAVATQLTLYSDTVSIGGTVPTISSVPDTTTNLCPGTPVTLTSSSTTGNTWNTGATTQSITTDSAGSYSVTVNFATSLAKKITYAICVKPAGTRDSAITSNSAIVKWNGVPCHTGYTLQYRKTGTTAYTTFPLPYLSHKIMGLLPSTTYEWRVRTVCIDSPIMAGAYTALSNFTTTAGLSDAFSEISVNGISLYPNPAHTSITVNFSSTDLYTSLQVIDASGKSMMQKEVAAYAGKNTVQIDVSKLAPGIYMLLIKTKTGILTKQFVKE